MKLKKSIIAFIVLFSVIVIFALSFKIHARTFSNFVIDKYSISVFYPKGIADKYKNIFVGINEDHRLWKYNLNNKETTNINNDLTNGVWQSIPYDGFQYIYKVYFSEYLFDYNITDEIYYCLYDLRKEEYINIDINDTLLYCQENLLFVYNKTTAEYYCVSIAF